MKLTRMRKEAGLAVVWLITFSAVFFGIAALVIDTMRQQVITQQAQNAADAAAFAAAGFLNGSVEGWGNAKRAAIDVFRQQNISGISKEELEEIEFNQGVIDPFEQAVHEVEGGNERYLGTSAEIGNVEITVERGQQWESGFRTLEVSDSDEDENTELSGVSLPVSYHSAGVSTIPLAYKVPVHMLANAVRVRVRVGNIRSTFGRIFGLDTLGIKERAATAISDSASTQKVLPLAIPVCKLLLNQTHPDESQYDTSLFVPENQCGREAVFTEANPFGLGGGQYGSRFQGLTRYLNYHKMENDRKLPLWGILGMPGGPADGVASPEDVHEAFKNLAQNGTLGSATLGSTFNPLEDVITTSSGLYRFPPPGSSDLSLQALLASLLTQSETSDEQEDELGYSVDKFVDAFTEGGAPIASYPHLRNDVAEDKIVDFGPEVSLEMKLYPNQAIPIIHPEQHPYTNPMCSSPEIYTQPLADRKVVSANVMLIAPSNPNTSYCDYQSVFNQEEQDTFPPSNLPQGPLDQATKPIVVGFMRVDLYDYRVSEYEEGEPIPGDANPVRLIPRGNPELFQNQKKFVEEHSEWARCTILPLCNPPLVNPPHCRQGPCGDRPDEPPAEEIPAAVEWNQWQECFYLPENYNLYKQCLKAGDPIRYLFLGCSFFFSSVSTWGMPNPDIEAEGKACFPEKKPGCWPEPGETWAESKCWTPPKPFEAQLGCGGIRARVSCDNARMTNPDLTGDVSRPKLVS